MREIDNSEVWLTTKQMVDQFGFATPSWLRRYGHKLPRTRVSVKDDKGIHHTSWLYPRNKIQGLLLHNADFS